MRGAAARSTLSPIASENHVGAFHSVARIATVTSVRIQFHKILSEGRSVRYDADPEGAVIHLSVIVTEDEARRKTGRSDRPDFPAVEFEILVYDRMVFPEAWVDWEFRRGRALTNLRAIGSFRT